MKIVVPPGLIRVVGQRLVSGLARSWRIETMHEERWRALYEARRPHIFMCWHEALLPLLWRHRGQGIAIVVSEAREGSYLADFAAAIGYRLVRGSSSRGATRALLGAVRELRIGNSVAFTPDGPRGPRRELKPGVVAASQRGHGLILPLHAEARRAWRLASWDRFMIPKPFTRVRITYGEPFQVAEGEIAHAEGLERARRALDECVRTAEWPDDGAILTA
jgi:lysophospholipid acyltransferase (LPLAT)-like uncharacterized protein